MDIGFVLLEPLFDFFWKICRIEFVFLGVELTVGALIFTGLLTSVVVIFIRRWAG